MAARVLLTPSIARAFAGGQVEHEVEGRVIHQNAFLEEVPDGAEVCFIPAIEGG